MAKQKPVRLCSHFNLKTKGYNSNDILSIWDIVRKNRINNPKRATSSANLMELYQSQTRCVPRDNKAIFQISAQYIKAY